MHVTLVQNGSDKIGGLALLMQFYQLKVLAVTLVYVDATQGWLVTDSWYTKYRHQQHYILQQQVEQLLVREITKFIHLQDQVAFCVSCAGNACRFKLQQII